MSDPRFPSTAWDTTDEPVAGPSSVPLQDKPEDTIAEDDVSAGETDEEQDEEDGDSEAEEDDGRIVKPLTPAALAEFEAAQARTGVVYISRIPPAMRPTKVRHLMSAFGEIGRVYLQQEDPKRAHLRKKHTSTKKAHFTEGWVEFMDKKVGRAVAEMLNGQPIGGKKGTRWRDDVWTMKYLPRFKWNMLTEQVAHESAAHTARLRVELSQSRTEQRDYLKQVELARVLEKREERKRKREEETGVVAPRPARPERALKAGDERRKKKARVPEAQEDMGDVLGQIF